MDQFEIIKSKVSSLDDALKSVSGWRVRSDKVVFTNGCFDILHPGHAEYLAKAASLGDRLVVGLNSDDSIKRLGKGVERPINNEDHRSIILASMHVIDHVVIFDEDTPINLIEAIKPDVLVKGGDWAKEDIVGSSLVENNGGTVEVIPFVDGHSTTQVIEKIRG